MSILGGTVDFGSTPQEAPDGATKTISRTVSALAGLAVLAAAAHASASELIQNGGFEGPDLGPFNFTYPGFTSYPGNPPEALIYP